MGYNIRNLQFFNFKGKTHYFLDANIWLKVLKPKIDIKAKDNKYILFFEDLCKKSQTKGYKIVVTSLLLSEIINRYIRDVTYKQYCKANNISNPDKSHYKMVYRTSPDFLRHYKSLCADIAAYDSYFELVNDGLGQDIQQGHLLSEPNHHLDFNDNYYYHLAQKRNYTIITDDEDFALPDIDIFTYNSRLIDRGQKN